MFFFILEIIVNLLPSALHGADILQTFGFMDIFLIQ